MRRKPDPRLHMELGILKLVTAKRMAPLEEVIAEMRGETPARPKAGTKSFAAAASPALGTSAVNPASNVAMSSENRGDVRGDAPRSRYDALASSGGAATAAVRAPIRERELGEDAALKGGATQVTPATATQGPVPASAPRVVANSLEATTSGLAAAQFEAIKSALQDQKFLWAMVEHVSRWELEGGEMRLYFPSERRSLAEMLQSRDPMERLRTAMSAGHRTAVARLC